MPLPHFLIIGAMKAGTTTLYRDLLTHPRIFFPLDKEPGTLTDDAVLTDTGRAAYADLFKDAGPDQLCAEASTAYTKRPTHEGVAERARSLLGPELRAIYIVRDPIERLRSQHRHEVTTGEIAETDLDEAVAAHPRLIDYSRYAYQLEPWLDALGPDRVLPIGLEAYSADRSAGAAAAQAFLGLEPRPDLVDAQRVFNRGDAKPVMTGPWRAIQRSAVYQKALRPLIGVETRQRLREAFLPKAKTELAEPSDATLAHLRERLEPDRARLRALLGAMPGGLSGEGAPSWLFGPESGR